MRRISLLTLPILALTLWACSVRTAPFVCGREAKAAEDAVLALLKTQSAAWNRGDLEAFTAVYAEDATFLSPTGITHGRDQVLARYKKRYPDPKAMGALSLDVVEARPVAVSARGTCQIPSVSVAARWKLTYPGQQDKKTAEGLTLLVLGHWGTVWKIVQDASM